MFSFINKPLKEIWNFGDQEFIHVLSSVLYLSATDQGASSILPLITLLESENLLPVIINACAYYMILLIVIISLHFNI